MSSALKSLPHRSTGFSLLSREQRNARSAGIGASDVPRILGLVNPIYGSALTVYREKRGLGFDSRSSEAAEWGNRLEAAIADGYEARLWQELMLLPHLPPILDVAPGNTLHHQHHRWAFATPDRLVHLRQFPHDYDTPVYSKWLLQCKARDARFEADWPSDLAREVPADVDAQVRWEMFVTGMDRCDVAVLFGGNRLKRYTVLKDDQKIDAIFAQVHAFWLNTCDGIPPVVAEDEFTPIAPPKIAKARIRWKDAARAMMHLVPDDTSAHILTEATTFKPSEATDGVDE